MKKYKIAVAGTGYVGLSIATLLISEYPPGTHPDRYRFPRRNRLISSWSDKLFVIQAEKGSGAYETLLFQNLYQLFDLIGF